MTGWPAGADEAPWEVYEPAYPLIAQYLGAAADAVLAAGHAPVTPDTILRTPGLHSLSEAEAAHLMDVLAEAGLVSAEGAARRRTVIARAGRPLKKALTKVESLAAVAAQLGDQPLESFDDRPRGNRTPRHN